jgi:hypothetical protein
MRLRFAFAIIVFPAALALAAFAGSAGGAEGQLLIATVGTNDGFDIVSPSPTAGR